MSRFIFVGEGREMINTDYISNVVNMEDGHLRIVFTDNTTYEVDEAAWNDIAGHNAIRQIYPCKNLAALVVIDGDTIPFPVSILALTASGQIRPMNSKLEFLDAMPKSIHIGYETYDNSDAD